MYAPHFTFLRYNILFTYALKVSLYLCSNISSSQTLVVTHYSSLFLGCPGSQNLHDNEPIYSLDTLSYCQSLIANWNELVVKVPNKTLLRYILLQTQAIQPFPLHFYPGSGVGIGIGSVRQPPSPRPNTTTDIEIKGNKKDQIKSPAHLNQINRTTKNGTSSRSAITTITKPHIIEEAI